MFQRVVERVKFTSLAKRGEAGNALVGDSARDNSAEVRQVGRDVDREAVERHPALHADPDRADLGLVGAVPGPDPDPPRFAARGDPEVGERGDHQPLERMDEAANVLAALFQVEDEITDALARAVIGVAPAATRVMDREAERVEQFRRVGAGARGEQGRMFEQPDQFGRGAGADRGGACLHLGKRILVSDEALADPPFDAVDAVHRAATWRGQRRSAIAEGQGGP